MKFSSIIGGRRDSFFSARHQLSLSDTGSYVLSIEDPLSKHPQFEGKLGGTAQFEVTQAIAEKILNDPDYRWIPE